MQLALFELLKVEVIPAWNSYPETPDPHVC